MTFITEYRTIDELLQGLQDKTVDKIWLFDCNYNGKTELEIRIVYVFPDNPVIGADVELVRYRRNVQKYFFECLDQWAEEEPESCYEEQVASKILRKRELECQKPEEVIVFGFAFAFLSD